MSNRQVVICSWIVVLVFYIVLGFVLAELLGTTLGVTLTILTAGLVVIYTTFQGIQAKPYREGIRTFFLRPVDSEVLKPGIYACPGYPLVAGLILEDVAKKNPELPEYTVRLPNETQVAYRFGLTVFVSNIYNFVKAGRWPEVLGRLQNDVVTHLSEWAQSKNYGPQNQNEAIQMTGEVIRKLMKGLLGNRLPQLPTKVPTDIVMKFFSDPRPEMFIAEKKLYPTWDAVEKQLHEDNPTPQDWENLLAKVKKRKEDFDKIRSGEGNWEIEPLGITIVRLNHHQIPRYVGKITEVASKKAEEQAERAGEREELEFGEEMIKRLSGMKPKDQLKFSPAESREFFQTERKKITKEIKEIKLNLSESSEAALERIANRLIDKLDKKKEPKNG